MNEMMENFLAVVWAMKWWIGSGVVIGIILLALFGYEDYTPHDLSWKYDQEDDGEFRDEWKCSCGVRGSGLTSAQVHLVAVLQKEKMS